MAGNRKAAEATALSWVNDVDPSGASGKQLAEFFKGMSDKNFDEWVLALKEKRDYVPITVEVLEKTKVTVENNLKVAEKRNVPMFERIWITDPTTGATYLSPIKYPVMYLPMRRQIQSLVNKVSIPEDNRHIDELTDQPVGPSKGSSLSFSELQILYAQGFDKSLIELMKYRGGDDEGFRQMDKALTEGGSVTTTQLDGAGTRAKSSDTLSTMFKAAHLDNNI